MRYIKLGTVVFAAFALAAFVWASESDELREKAEAIQREAVALAEQGLERESANLMRKAMVMREQAAQLETGLGERHPEIMKLKQWLEKLRREEGLLTEKAGSEERLADVRREAEQIEAKLEVLLHRHHDHQAPPNEEIARRLEHMRIAVDHLNQAGLPDIAEHVAQRAEAAERELHAHGLGQGGDVVHEIMQQLEELRHEVGRLHDEMNELRNRRP